MIKFSRKNMASKEFPVWVYEAKFNGYSRGNSRMGSFSKVRIAKGVDGWEIFIDVSESKMEVAERGYETLRDAKDYALLWAA
jgi:hypothetical protein